MKFCLNLIHFRWCCGTKSMLSRLSSQGLKAAPSDSHEELQIHTNFKEKLEDDQDVFQRDEIIKDAKWKFIGDSAFLLPTDVEIKNEKNQTFDNVSNIEPRKR